MANPVRLESNKLELVEGLAGDLEASVTNNARRWTLIVQGEDTPASRAKFGVLRKVATLLDSVLEEKTERNWQDLVEALTPDPELSPNRVIEAGMLGQAMAAVLASNEFFSAAAIARLAHFSSKNPSSQPNRWKRSGQIFAVDWKGTDLYPLYAFDMREGLRPLPIVADILKLFPDKDGWQVAFWFGSVNSYLGDAMPKDLLKSHPNDVLKAAKFEAAGVLHG